MGSLWAAALPQKVMICGVCQNVERPLPYTLKIMEQIGALFADYQILIYENNSTDQTLSILKKWQEKNPRVEVMSENISESELASQIVNLYKEGGFYRAELIARARNIVLDRVMSEQYAEFPYLIWMDMDFKLPPDLDGFLEVFQTEREWDAVLAYGIDPYGVYWDWYACRTATYPLGSELLGMHWWYMPKILNLSPADDWLPVYSAFGGCGIYKKASIVGCRYAAVVTEDLETLSRQEIEEGLKAKHPQIIDYLKRCQKLRPIITIDRPVPNLPSITHPETGILRSTGEDALIWRMSHFVDRYPSVCEHVTFHASMIIRGHGKLFINPRLIFTYGG